METVRHDDRVTAYRRDGQGESPICFVHGSGGTHEVWKPQYGHPETPFSTVALDLSGHGGSDDIDTEPGAETFDAYAADGRAVIEESGAELLVGNSMGGAVLLWLVLETDVSPAGLVLAGTGAQLPVHPDLQELLAEDFERALDVLHGEDMLFHDPRPEYVDQSKATMRAVGQDVTERDFLSCHEFDVRDRLDEIDVPTLALVGEYDQMTPLKYHEQLAAELPDCEVVEIEDAAHLAMIDQPERFTTEIERFRQRI